MAHKGAPVLIAPTRLVAAAPASAGWRSLPRDASNPEFVKACQPRSKRGDVSPLGSAFRPGCRREAETGSDRTPSSGG